MELYKANSIPSPRVFVTVGVGGGVGMDAEVVLTSIEALLGPLPREESVTALVLNLYVVLASN